MLYRIDDSIADHCEKQKLLEIGLVYGDVIAFNKFFNKKEPHTEMKTYQEKADDFIS